MTQVPEKRIPLVKQLEEEFSADDLGLLLQGLLASWVDSTCSGVSHCTLHRLILQAALKCSDLDIADHLGQFCTLGAKASSWCAKHFWWPAKCIDQSQVVEEEEHNRLCQEVSLLSLSISTKLLDIAAKCITVLGLEVAEGEEGQGAVQDECVLNKADNLFPTLENMAVEVGLAPLRGPDGPSTLCSACGRRFLNGFLLDPNPHRRGRPSTKGRPCIHCGSEMVPKWRQGADGPGTLCSACGQRFLKGPLLYPNPRRASIKGRRCMHCASEKTSRWSRGPDGPATLCNKCGKRFLRGRLLHSDSKKRCSTSKEDSAAGIDVAALAEALSCGVGASLDAFFDQTCSEVPWGEAGAERMDEEEEEELEWLSNKDAFPSVETMAVEVEEGASAPDVPRARTKGRQRVTAMETTCRQANVPPLGDLRAEKGTVRRCTHCATEKTPQWRKGPEGLHTLCNACGAVYNRKGGLLAKETVRRCTRCATEKTPQWREGPEGPRTLCNACGLAFKKKRRLLPEYRPGNSPAFSPLVHSNIYSRALDMLCRNDTSATGEMQVELMDPPANSPTSSPLERYSSLCHVLGEETSAAEASRGEESMEVQLLPERPPVDSPAFSLVPHSRVLKRRRKSEAQTFAAIRATAKAGRADRAAARLATMDN
ncbi:unnamed protein product [Alopecurus aequalis]